jgi:hypothetical protein
MTQENILKSSRSGKRANSRCISNNTGLNFTLPQAIPYLVKTTEPAVEPNPPAAPKKWNIDLILGFTSGCIFFVSIFATIFYKIVNHTNFSQTYSGARKGLV